MSKLIDRLKQVSQPAPRPMGFGSRTTEVRARIQMLVHPTAATASIISQITMADAIVLPSLKRGNGDGIRGLWLKKGEIEEVVQAIENGADFIVLTTSGNAIPSDKKIGKVLQIDTSLTDILLRTVNELPVDAVIVNDEKGAIKPVTWLRLMSMERIVAFVSKPVLVNVSADINSADLQMIWDTGVSGIVVDIGTEAEAGLVKNLRETIESLSFPVKKKKEGLTVVLHQVSGRDSEEEPDEDDDADE